MCNFKITDKVRFKNSGTKQVGTIIGIFEENVYDKDNKEIVIYKGEFKVRMDNHEEGRYTPAQKEELELVK